MIFIIKKCINDGILALGCGISIPKKHFEKFYIPVEYAIVVLH